MDDTREPSPRVAVLVVAYNAASTLATVLDRIPDSFARTAHVLVSDDHSHDATFDIGSTYAAGQTRLRVTVVRQPRNLGYGGNQKFGYRWAIDDGFDAVVLLHGDGQYAPELLHEMVAPILRGDADVVLGSRMMERGNARAGGMPLYKYIGNRVLTRYQNAVAGMSLTEWHSGYRAFAARALAAIPFERNSDGFDFDTEVLLQLAAHGARITEIPIPTYYGDEICYVDGVKYARQVVADVTRMRLARMGFGQAAPGTLPDQYDEYEWKPGADSSHHALVELVRAQPAGTLLDLGCGPGHLAGRAQQLGHTTVGIDAFVSSPTGVDHFVHADLDRGLPDEAAQLGPYETVVAADVLEHVRDPGALLDQIAGVTTERAKVLVSIPNFAHWYVRARVVTGTFDYDRRGILDAGHVRFFTRRSFERLTAEHGWAIDRTRAVGLPFDVLDRGGRPGLGSSVRRMLGALDRAAVRVWPTLFAYQYVFVLSRR